MGQVRIRHRVLGLLLVVGLSFGLLTWAPGASSAEPPEPNRCQGDEQISFAPAQPLAGEELLVAVSSSREHRGVWLTGSERPVAVRVYPGQLGTVWNWTAALRREGPHRFQFYVDSTILCAEATITVGAAIRPDANASPTVSPPIVSVGRLVRGGGDNGSDNEDGGDGDNQADNGAVAGAPSISSVSPQTACAGSVLSIHGRGFGASRSDVGGKIVIAGATVQDYLSWGDDEVNLLVPDGATVGPKQPVYFVTDGGFVESEITVSAAPCSDLTGQPAAPRIKSLKPSSVCPGARLTIRGKRFGGSRSEVGGKVLISGAEVSDYLSWESDRVTVLVPSGATAGDGRPVYLVTSGGSAQAELDIGGESCSGGPEEPPEPPEPRIKSLDPVQVCAGSRLKIRGAGFGQSRDAVDGKVVVSGAEVRDYLGWRDSEIVVLVPNSAGQGLKQAVYVITAGGFDQDTLQVSAAPC